jgi:hypothetical protein
VAVIEGEFMADSDWAEVSIAPDDCNTSLSVIDGSAEVTVLLNSLSVDIDKGGLPLISSVDDGAARLGLVVNTKLSEVKDWKPLVMKEVPDTRLLPGGKPLPSVLDSSVDEITELSEDENTVRRVDCADTSEEMTDVLKPGVEKGAPLLSRRLVGRLEAPEMMFDDSGCSKELTIVSDGDAWKEVIAAAEDESDTSIDDITLVEDSDNSKEVVGSDTDENSNVRLGNATGTSVEVSCTKEDCSTADTEDDVTSAAKDDSMTVDDSVRSVDPDIRLLFGVMLV